MKAQLEVLTAWVQSRFTQTDRGASLVEYALLVALIAVLCIAAVSFIGSSAETKFNSAGSAISK